VTSPLEHDSVALVKSLLKASSTPPWQAGQWSRPGTAGAPGRRSTTRQAICNLHPPGTTGATIPTSTMPGNDER